MAARTLGNLRMMEADAKEAKENAKECEGTANAASDRADQMRSGRLVGDHRQP